MTDTTPALSVCIEMVFANRPISERIELAADAGADAIEFWGWREKDLEEIKYICNRYNIEISGMIGTDVPLTNPEKVEEAVTNIQNSIEIAERYNCQNLIITVGPEQDNLEKSEQQDAIVSSLSQVAPEAERANVTLTVEPLNTAIDHPDYYLTSSEEGFTIVDRVDSPAVGLLFDIYHQQITEGNVTRAVTKNLENIHHIHIADNPGRQEPGTGELNYENIITTILKNGYDKYIGCEFRPSRDHVSAIEYCNRLVNVSPERL